MTASISRIEALLKLGFSEIKNRRALSGRVVSRPPRKISAKWLNRPKAHLAL